MLADDGGAEREAQVDDESKGVRKRGGAKARRSAGESIYDLLGVCELAGELVDARDMLLRLRAGDQDAEKLLIEQLKLDRAAGRRDGLGLVFLSAAFTPLARAHLARTLPTLSWDERDNAWHRALFEIWRHIDDYDAGKSRFQTWVCRMAQWQSPRRRPGDGMIVLVADLGEGPEPPSDAGGVTPEQHERLMAALARLREAERDLVEMRQRDELTYKEMSERLGGRVSPGAIRVAVHRIMLRLHAWMR